MGHAMAGLLTLAGCAARAPVQAPVTAPTQGAPRACEAQMEQVDDALVRLADRYLWDEVERLLQLALVTRRGLGQGCSEAARAALLKVARRWAEEGASSGGGQVYDLAQRAYLALATHFPGAQAELEHLFGRLEFTRAGRVGNAGLQPAVAREQQQTFAVRVQPPGDVHTGQIDEIPQTAPTPFGCELAQYALGLVEQHQLDGWSVGGWRHDTLLVGLFLLLINPLTTRS